MLLDKLLPETTADGCFVAIPGRDQLLVLPVTTSGLAHLPLLKALAQKSHKSAPYSISDDVFWIRAGRWQRFPIQIRGEHIAVEPPADFLEILQRLAPLEDGDSPPESG
jgi:hypothetical protein